MPQILFLHAQEARLFFNLNNGVRMFIETFMLGLVHGIVIMVIFAEYKEIRSRHK